MSLPVLFEVPPSPPPVTGYASLAVVVIIVLTLTVGLLGGLVLLIKRIKRRRAKPLDRATPDSEDRSAE